MPDLDDELYQERILDHFEQPYHRGSCPSCSHAHEDDNPLCGDIVRVELALQDNKVKQAWFGGEGCCISQAAASMLMQEIEGKPLDEVKQMSGEDMLKLFGAQADAEPPEVLFAKLARVAERIVLAGANKRPLMARIILNR